MQKKRRKSAIEKRIPGGCKETKAMGPFVAQAPRASSEEGKEAFARSAEEEKARSKKIGRIRKLPQKKKSPKGNRVFQNKKEKRTKATSMRKRRNDRRRPVVLLL